MHFNVNEFEGDKVKQMTTYLDNVTVLTIFGLMPAPEPLELTPSFEIPDPEPNGLSPIEDAMKVDVVWDAHDLVGYANMFHPDATIMLGPLGVTIDKDTFIALEELYFMSSSDLHEDVIRMIDMEDGWVMYEVMFVGTNDGPRFGVPATGRYSEVRGVVLQRFNEDGLITEMSAYWDELTALMQLGLFPPPTGIEANKALVQRAFDELINQRNPDIADEIYPTDYVYHFAGNPDVHGLEGIKQFMASHFADIPDVHYTIEGMIAEGDKVSTRVTFTGTHQGTGKQVTVTGTMIHRIADGKIAEDWGVYDGLGMIEQLGVIPAEPKDYTWGMPSEVTGEPGNPEENKAIMRRVVEEVLNQKDLDLVDEFYATDYVFHVPGNPTIRSSEGFKQYFSTLFAAFPDFHITIEDIFAEGDKVVSRLTMRGTQTGEFMGIPPTGKQTTATGILINRFADGKIVEDWESYDFLSFMQQLGIIPSEDDKSVR